MTYALHFALLPERNRTDILQALPAGSFTDAFVDGDSYLEWGEAQGDAPAHGMVYFENRYQAGPMIGLLFAAHVADLSHSFAVTTADDWSVKA